MASEMPLPRLQLYELGDASWLPGWVREEYLRCLNFVQRSCRAYRSAYRPFAAWCEQSGAQPVLDLASGGGYPIAEILSRAAETRTPLPPITLSDLYPVEEHFRQLSTAAGSERLTYLSTPLPALGAPQTTYRAFSICGALHHLPPSDTATLLRTVAEQGKSIFILEPYERSWRCLLITLFLGLPLGMAYPLFDRPFRLRSLLFGTLFPLIPLLVQLDGLISVLRTYHPEELTQMIPAHLLPHLRLKSARLKPHRALAPNFFYLTPKTPPQKT